MTTMGYMRHHAIVVTTWNDGQLRDLHEAVRAEAERRFQSDAMVSGITGSAINGYTSFLVAPDGSKEGWETSDEGDAFREWIIERIEGQAYDDGSNALDYAEVQFGDEEGDDRLLRSTNVAAPSTPTNEGTEQ